MLRGKLNWPTLILSSIIVDLEPLVAIVAGLDYPPHGLLHTFLASIPAGALAGFILYLVREQAAPYFADLALIDKRGSLKSLSSLCCRLGLITILMGAYILSLLALAMLWPALRLLQRNLSDYTFSMSLNLMITVWILAPLLIPLLITALLYVIIVIKTPHKLRCLKEKTLN